MKSVRFALRTRIPSLTIKGGFLREGIKGITSFETISENKHELRFLFTEDLSRESFEKKILETIRKERPFVFYKLMLQNRIGSLLTVVMSVLIIIFIALLSIHGSMTYDLFMGNDSENILGIPATYFYLLLTLIILVMLYYSPKIILGEFSNLLEWAEAKLTSEKKIRKRIMRQVTALVGLKNDEGMLLAHNPLIQGSDSWIVIQLIPVLLSLKFRVSIYVNSDEKSDILRILEKNDLAVTSEESPAEPSTETLTSIFPAELLTIREREGLALITFCSMLNLPEKWGRPERIVFSQNLFEISGELFGNRIYSVQNGSMSADRFILRCIHDYGYLLEKKVFGRKTFFLHPEINSIQLDKSGLKELRELILSDLGLVAEKVADPLANILLMGMMDEGDHVLKPKRLLLLENYIENTLTTENFLLFSDYWKHVSKIKEEDNYGFQFSVLHFFSVKALKNLSTCFVNSGLYASAMEVYEILENVYPVKAAIDIADMQDSLGNYKESLKILYETDEKWAQSGIVRDEGLLLELYLNIAWIIVSGRFTDEKKKGYSYLKKTDDILKRLPDSEEYLTYLIRFYNTRANYSEWEKKYTTAIEDYEKALKLPGSILRKSSLLSNRGIAERLLGNSIGEHSVQKTEHYRKARSIARQGLEMKKAIGEKNQIPGASHNYAETLLELSRSVVEEEEKRDLLREAFAVSSDALTLLDELNSEKRRGRLLTERYIAMVGLSDQAGKTDREVALSELQNWLEREDKDSYDYREIQRLLQRFSIKV